MTGYAISGFGLLAFLRTSKRIGSSAADLPAVVDLLVRLSCLASDSADLEIEFEDIVVHERGEGLTVARARLVELPDA